MERMGFRRFNTLSDIAKMGYWLRLTCKCGHTRRADTDKLLERLMRRGADTRLSHLVDNLKCGECGRKDFEATHCEGPMITSGR